MVRVVNVKRDCAYCGKPHGQTMGAVNRAIAGGYRLYCGRKCSGLGRRKHKSKAQRVEEKRIYDAAYREKNRGKLKALKRAYFRRTYDPAKAAIQRKSRMHLHVEYCRRPEYRAYKRDYDAKYRAQCDYGPFWESGLYVIELDKEIKKRATFNEIAAAKGTVNKSLQRRREYERLNSSQP